VIFYKQLIIDVVENSSKSVPFRT